MAPAIRWLPAAVLMILFLFVLIRTAWVCDDAFITLRTVDNFVNGFGLRFNVAERVQAYTHPLWMFLLAAFYAVTREPFYTVLSVSIATTLVALGLHVTRVAIRPLAAALGLLPLVFSKAFVEYATSGLENPLTHLLLVVFVMLAIRHAREARNPMLLVFVAALLALNRLDALLLVLPLLAVRLWKRPLRTIAAALLIGFLPLLAWFAFSLLYYGYPFPNTAYAKLGSGVARTAYFQQGFVYLWDSLTLDPITLITIAASVVYGCVRRGPLATPLAAGIVLYLVYVVWVGGDFMSGRFLTAPLFVAVLLLTFRSAPIRSSGAAATALLLLGALNPAAPLYSPRAGPTWIHSENGVGDERAFYYEYLGLLPALAGAGPQTHPWAIDGAEVRKAGYDLIVVPTIGLIGYYAGPGVYVVDQNALCDPLLVYLPARRDRPLRIGHMERIIPAGYYDSIRNDDNRLEDAALSELYDLVRVVTRGPPLDGRRLRAILSLNFGRYPAVGSSE